MPKPVSRYEKSMDWSPPEGDSDEICNVGFRFTKKLSEMSEEEKDQLYREYVTHSKTVMSDDVAEVTPTIVIDDPKPRPKPKPAPVTKDKGIIVEGEDFDVLKGIVGEEQAKKMMSRKSAREVGEGEFERREMASKPAAKRNAIARFENI